MTPRIVVRPGYVTSQTDGDRHYIGVPQLLWLYRVPLGASYIVVEDRDVPAFREQADDIIVQPRFDGQYPVFAEGEPQ